MTNTNKKLIAIMAKANERKKEVQHEIVKYDEMISIYQREITYREGAIRIIEELEYVYKNTQYDKDDKKGDK